MVIRIHSGMPLGLPPWICTFNSNHHFCGQRMPAYDGSNFKSVSCQESELRETTSHLSSFYAPRSCGNERGGVHLKRSCSRQGNPSNVTNCPKRSEKHCLLHSMRTLLEATLVSTKQSFVFGCASSSQECTHIVKI